MYFVVGGLMKRAVLTQRQIYISRIHLNFIHEMHIDKAIGQMTHILDDQKPNIFCLNNETLVAYYMSRDSY